MKKLRSDHDMIFNAKKLELDELKSSQMEEMNVQIKLDNDLYGRIKNHSGLSILWNQKQRKIFGDIKVMNW